MPSLTIRKTDRGVRIQGDLPSPHTFPTSFLDREFEAGSGVVDITITLNTDDGPVTYRMTGFERQDEDPTKPNVTGLVCELVSDDRG